MSRFNTLKESKKTKNLAGGTAFKQSKEMSLISLLLTSFVNDQFYRDSNKSIDDLKSLISDIDDKKFIAKSAIFARDKFGMRSITHVISAELASYLSGKDWGKDFYENVVSRVDDMTEILAYYISNKTDSKNPKFPNSMKKGFAKAFNKFDDYQLAKYKNSKKSVKLVDVVNIVHPIPNVRNKKSLNSLINDNLKNTETWEAKMSKAGQEANSSQNLDKLKSDVWGELINSRKIGYFALLKNLRNIILQAPNHLDAACELLVDKKLIEKSKVLPFRFTSAYNEISKITSSASVRKVKQSLNEAIEISMSNVPKFNGETLVVMDVSGSMRGRASKIAALFGASIAKVNNCDVMTFSNHSKYVSYNPMDSLTTIRDSFNFSGGGTNFRSIFEVANKKYDRIIILSDMQAWGSYYSPTKEFYEYKQKYDANPFVYSWDLAGYGTLQFPENNVFSLAGFSEKVFDVMKFMESDKNSFYKEINSIKI